MLNSIRCRRRSIHRRAQFVLDVAGQVVHPADDVELDVVGQQRSSARSAGYRFSSIISVLISAAGRFQFSIEKA